MTTKRAGLLFLVCFSFFTIVSAVKHSDFKKCNQVPHPCYQSFNLQSSFCRRNRDLATSISSNPHYSSLYSLANDISLQGGLFTATILKSIENGVEKVELPLVIQFFKSGVARVTIDEKRRQKKDIDLPEGKSHVRKERYNAVVDAVIIGGKELDTTVNDIVTRDKSTRIRYGNRVDQEIIIHHYPFKLEFLRDDRVEMVLNERNFLNVEHWRPKSIKKEQEQKKEGQVGDEQTINVDGADAKEGEEEEEEEEGMWEESFNGKTDSKPRGISMISVV
jgi:alpha 1,3-glucosidase